MDVVNKMTIVNTIFTINGIPLILVNEFKDKSLKKAILIGQLSSGMLEELEWHGGRISKY
jgi:hypothetical protein